MNRMKIIPRRHVKGKMNKHEQMYADILDAMLRAGTICAYHFESVRFTLAPNTTYTPDFMVVYDDRIELVEVKGWLQEDANVKFKAVADKFPYFSWKMIRYKNKTEGWTTVREI